MSNVISVHSTVAQAEGFEVEIRDTTLLSSRYFPTSEGDNFAGKEVLFDFDSGDLEKGAFLSSGFKEGNTTQWVANSVIPPRVANADVIDPTNQDRVMFERLCRAQGADVDRSIAYQDLLAIKAARLAKRTDRAKEVLAALVLKSGKISFDQYLDATETDTEAIVCRFYDAAKGADNHFAPKVAWNAEGCTPYNDVCAMVHEGMKHGRRYTDLVLGADAWIALANDEKFRAFSGATYHSDGMALDFGDVDGAQHVARAVFHGVQLNVIVYSGAYKADDGTLKSFIDSYAAIVIAEGIGRGLQGGSTLLNPEYNGYGIEGSFIGLTGVHMQSIYKDLDKQRLVIREESRPLPAPKHSVNSFDWIYCDTRIANVAGGIFGDIAAGISLVADPEVSWSVPPTDTVQTCRPGDSIAIEEGTPASGTVKVYALRDGVKSGTPLTISGKQVTLPVDCDKNEQGLALLWATAE